jgi:hypothetical protein
MAWDLLHLERRQEDDRGKETWMPHTKILETSHDDSLGDFVAHLQERFGISRVELGECLTSYRPARAYSIVLGTDSRPQSELPGA